MHHHYIPVFYLNNWRALNGRMVEFSRPRPGSDLVKPRPTSPTGTGYVDDLYALDGTRPQRLESFFFSPADDKAAIALNKMLTNAAAGLTSDERSAWSRFIMSLLLRSPEDVVDLKSLVEYYLTVPDAMSKEYLEARSEGDPLTLEDWAMQNADAVRREGLSILPRLIDNPKIGGRMNAMRWSVQKRSPVDDIRPASDPDGITRSARLVHHAADQRDQGLPGRK